MAETVPTTWAFPAPVHGRSVEFATYGEATHIPVHIRAACVSVVAPALTCRAAQHFLCSVEMTVEQDAVENGSKGCVGKLRVPLPVDATVSRFEFQRTCPERDGEMTWYPAVPVAKRKAKEVAYREKEKGRSVAVASEVAGGGNVFEIEVSPLLYKTPVKCRLEYLAPSKACASTVSSLQDVAPRFPAETDAIYVQVGRGERELLTEAALPNSAVGATASVGTCFGKQHFVCTIPSAQF